MNSRLTITSAASLALAGLLLCTAVPARSQGGESLVDLINAYRAAPGHCEGPRAPLPALAPHPALAEVRIRSGDFLDLLLARAGYPVAQADAIFIAGPVDARAAMAAIQARYCRTLLDRQFSAIGARRSGDSWQIVLARPAPPSPLLLLPPSDQAGKAILDAVNLARASARQCGEAAYAAAPALSWNAVLADAALAHSQDMARQRYFNHRGKDGRQVHERALQAGYLPGRVGENIAVGQESPEEVVAGWLTSPGHCANIMHPGFRDMGAAYAVNPARETPRAYWTQVFGAPR